MSDRSKTKKELLAELESLRNKLAEREAEGPAADEGSQPVFAGPMTRRTAMTAWVAPVVLSIPLATMARRAGAQDTPSFIPSLEPTPLPTQRPTPAPSVEPTPFPSFEPTPFPTNRPTTTRTTTAFPTAFPTATPRVPALGIGAAAALGGALAVGVAKVAANRAAKDSTSDADAGDTGSGDDNEGNTNE